MIKFLLLINKQGQTRLAKYYFDITVEERMALEGELIRKCLSRSEKQVILPPTSLLQCAFVDHGQYKAVYRRYASLYFIVGVDEDDENELSMLEFIHNLVETLDRYFVNVVRKLSLFTSVSANSM